MKILKLFLVLYFILAIAGYIVVGWKETHSTLVEVEK